MLSFKEQGGTAVCMQTTLCIHLREVILLRQVLALFPSLHPAVSYLLAPRHLTAHDLGLMRLCLKARFSLSSTNDSRMFFVVGKHHWNFFPYGWISHRYGVRDQSKIFFWRAKVWCQLSCLVQWSWTTSCQGQRAGVLLMQMRFTALWCGETTQVIWKTFA